MQRKSEALDKRLARLERWNRALLLVIGAGLVGAAGLVQSHPRSLQAESIQLVSPSGDVLAELGVRDGTPGLYLADDKGQTRAALFHAADATGLYIMDEDGVTRIGVAQFAHGGGGVALHGPASKGAAVLYLKGEGSLRFFDAEGDVTNQVSGRRPENSGAR